MMLSNKYIYSHLSVGLDFEYGLDRAYLLLSMKGRHILKDLRRTNPLYRVCCSIHYISRIYSYHINVFSIKDTPPSSITILSAGIILTVSQGISRNSFRSWSRNLSWLLHSLLLYFCVPNLLIPVYRFHSNINVLDEMRSGR